MTINFPSSLRYKELRSLDGNDGSPSALPRATRENQYGWVVNVREDAHSAHSFDQAARRPYDHIELMSRGMAEQVLGEEPPALHTFSQSSLRAKASGGVPGCRYVDGRYQAVRPEGLLIAMPSPKAPEYFLVNTNLDRDLPMNVLKNAKGEAIKIWRPTTAMKKAQQVFGQLQQGLTPTAPMSEKAPGDYCVEALGKFIRRIFKF